MTRAYPTDAAREFLADIAERNEPLAAKLRDEIRDGTFTHLDDIECRVVVPEWRPVALVSRQERLL